MFLERVIFEKGSTRGGGTAPSDQNFVEKTALFPQNDGPYGFMACGNPSAYAP